MKLNEMMRFLGVCAVLALAGCVTPAEVASAPPAAMEAKSDHYEQDRQAILAMAGNFKVTFDFIETVSFVEGYDLKDRKLSGGNEIVRVIEDSGDFISLQHILVVGGDDKFPIKHWRQDWRYEPENVLVFIGGNTWENRAVSAGQANGKWSQTVYQVDDAPRYGAVGAWSHVDGVSQWTPPAEWRPLPRRDATTRDDYHAVKAVNRHAITPYGWVHEQNNSKLVLDGEPQTLVREIAINTYRRSDDFPIEVGDEYWAKTADYWAGVRDKWSLVETENSRFGLTIQGEPEELYNQLLGLANFVADGEMESLEALGEARAVIDEYVTSDPAPLSQRIAQASE